MLTFELPQWLAPRLIAPLYQKTEQEFEAYHATSGRTAADVIRFVQWTGGLRTTLETTLDDEAYDPEANVILLPQAMLESTQLKALARAAHLGGHALQAKQGTLWYRLSTQAMGFTRWVDRWRNRLVIPTLVLFVALIGGAFLPQSTQAPWNTVWGISILLLLLVGIPFLFFQLLFLFHDKVQQLILLLTEWEASRKATHILEKSHYLARKELNQAWRYLSHYATYRYHTAPCQRRSLDKATAIKTFEDF